MLDGRTSSAYQRIETEERKRETETLKELKTLTEPSDADAQFSLGRRYVVGAGVPQDDAEAVK